MNAMRMTLLSIAAIMMLGIWLTGFDKAHWVLYLPPAFLAFAGMTGICPGLIFWSKVGLKNEALSCALPSTKPKDGA
jgi:hypothetical protein